MRKRWTLFVVAALCLMLTACGDNADTTNNQNSPVDEPMNEPTISNNVDEQNEQNEPNDQNEQSTLVVTQQEMQEKMDELDYTEFELEVEYHGGQEYEAELEKKKDNSVKAEIEDSLNNIKKKGTDAFNELFPLVKQLTITQETTKDDAIQQILTTFNLPTDYEEFELELRFKDGTKLEFKDRK